MPEPRIQSRIYARAQGDRIRRVNLHTKWWQDLYHHALTMRWWWFLPSGAVLYAAVNAMFALLYLLQPGSIQGARPGSFADAFFFSVQCLSTIGFGSLVPATLYANILTTLEAFASWILVALATGSVFARISRPRARVLFARRAVVTRYNGVPTLSFRLANERLSQIIEASVSVVLLRSEQTAEGADFRRFYDLTLARSRTPVFALSFTVMHPITEDSPLHGLTPEALEAEDAELVITVTGLEEVTSQTVHARYSYLPHEIVWGHTFADIFSEDDKGRRLIDYGRFHETKPAVT
ncbi:MAG TPA: ion channel [Acetobacteraceae bacterium]|nr:ion channel [Acetobacteraceae bacterium]